MAQSWKEAAEMWQKKHEELIEYARKMKKERDLALAHDTQPYPTAEAYEKVCQLLKQSKIQLTAKDKQIEGLKKWINEFNDSNQRLEDELALMQGYLSAKDRRIKDLEVDRDRLRKLL